MKTKKRILATTLATLVLGAGEVFAQTTATDVKAGFGTLKELIDEFTKSIVVSLGTLLMAGAVVIFFLGIVQYIWGLRQGNPEKVKTGNQFMLWGLVALFVMFSVYGIVKFAQGIFFKSGDVNTITIPEIKFNTSSTPAAGEVCVPAPTTGCSNPCSMGNGQTGTCKNNTQCCKTQ